MYEQPRLSNYTIRQLVAECGDVFQEPMLHSYLIHCHSEREAREAIASLRIHHPAIFKRRRQ